MHYRIPAIVPRAMTDHGWEQTDIIYTVARYSERNLYRCLSSRRERGSTGAAGTRGIRPYSFLAASTLNLDLEIKVGLYSRCV